MPNIILRLHKNKTSEKDLVLSIKENTLDYLMTGDSEEVRVSSFFEADVLEVQSEYEELYLNEECPSFFEVLKVIPGSRTKRELILPGPMFSGEQFTIQVKRITK